MTDLRFFCFGGFELFDGAEALLKPTTLKAQSLLAYLLRHPQRPFPREHLMTLFWGERPTYRARRSLSTALWHIRRCLPTDEAIGADNQTVRWQADFWLDAAAFEQLVASDELAGLETAVSLYRGDFLEGFYDEWVIDERYQLHSRFLQLLSHLTNLYEATAQYQSALTTALRLLEQDALQESAHRAAMRVYAHLGQRNAALEQFRQCRSIVYKELGVEPMPETQALYDEIRDGRFTPHTPSHTPDIRHHTPHVAAHTQPTNSPFVGRQKELAILQQHWQNKQHSLILLSGEAGIGKTRLLQQFTHQLQRPPTPHAILNGRCYEYERLLPYQPFAEALHPLVTTLSTADWAQLPDWVLTELARLLPDLLDRLPRQQLADLSPDRTRLFNAVGRLLTTLAEQRPLLLILEDLHWATESTLQLLHYLTRQLAQQPILLLGTYRQEQVGSEHPLTAVQRQLSRENLAHTITLSRLTVDEVQEMVIELTGETAVPLAQRLYNETEGNPFYLMETMQTLFETEAITRQGKQQDWTMVDLPLAPGIMAAIEARVQRLSPSAQDAVRLAAVLGREFDYDLLNAVWGQGEEQTLAALDDLLRARLIAEGTGALGRDYAFTHHKIQEAVYAALPQTRRWHSHARVAPIMEAHYPLAEVVSELGFHYQQGRQADDSLTPKAVAYLQMAGEQAANQFAHEEAIGYLGQALDVLAAGDAARIPLLLAREKILNMQGDRTAQAQDLAELSQLATTPAQQADIALRQIHYATVTGKYDKAITIAQAAIPSAPTDELRISIRLQWGLALHHQGGFETAVTQFQTALTQARSANLPQLSAKCLTSLSLCYWRQSQYDEAEACCSAALEICRQPEARDRVTEANALGNLGILARYRSDYATAKTYFEQALTLWREIGLRRGQGFNLLNLGVIGFDTADYAAGKEYFAQALTIFREIEDRSSEQLVLSNLSVIAYFQGDFMETIRLAQEALAICREIGERHGEGVNFANLGVATAALGQYDEAEGYYEQSLTIRRERGDRRGEGIALHGLGDVALGRGDLATAVTHCQQAHTILHEIGDRAEEGLVLRTLAEIEMANGRFPTARSHLDEALQISQQINSPLLEGQVLTVLADLACREGEWETAVAHSQQALTIAEQIGAQALAGDAWLANGLALAGLGRQKEAVQAFNEAIRIRRRIKQEHLLTEPLAGLARIKQ